MLKRTVITIAMGRAIEAARKSGTGRATASTRTARRLQAAGLAFVRCQAAGIRRDLFVVELTQHGREVEL